MTKRSEAGACRCGHPLHPGQCHAAGGCWCDSFAAPKTNATPSKCSRCSRPTDQARGVSIGDRLYCGGHCLSIDQVERGAALLAACARQVDAHDIELVYSDFLLAISERRHTDATRYARAALSLASEGQSIGRISTEAAIRAQIHLEAYAFDDRP